MDHKTFLQSLDPADREDLTKLSDAKGLKHLIGHWGAISLCGIWIYNQAPLWQIVLAIQGILLLFLFTLLHETSHKTPFKTSWINTLVGHVCGFVLFLPATWFRYFHFAHHRFTQIPGKDPELDAPKPDNALQYFVHVSGIPIWISHAKTLFRNAVGKQLGPFVPEGRQTEIKAEARAYLLGYLTLLALSIWMATPVLLTIWLLPMLFGQPFLRLYLLAEHGRCPTVANMLENTRTTYTNMLVRRIAWNMPYHTEHHCYPTVPFHKLPDLHQRIQPRLVNTSKGYTAFNIAFFRDALD